MRRSSTYERYRDILKRHILSVFGQKKIDEIKRVEIRNLFLKKEKAKFSRSMICLIRDMMSGPMGYAVDEELIPGNPVAGILKRLQLERDKRITVEPMNEEEVDLFLDACFKHFREYWEFFLLSQGESPVYVKEQLGHSSIQMTVDIYGHLIPGSNRGAVNRLDSTQPSATCQNRKAVIN